MLFHPKHILSDKTPTGNPMIIEAAISEDTQAVSESRIAGVDSRDASPLRGDWRDPNLSKLTEYTGRDGVLDALTDRQRTVLEMAYEMKLYEIPRESLTEEIMVRLNLDVATVSDHLQQAEQNLRTRQLLT